MFMIQSSSSAISAYFVVYPLPWPLLMGESHVPVCSPPTRLTIHLASSVVTPSWYVHKSKDKNVVLCMYKEDIMVMNVIWCRLCVSMIWRTDDLFFRTRVQRVRRGSISSNLLMCGGGVRIILLLPLVDMCLETIDICIWRMFVFMSVVVTV